jgi:hypothetical protein
MSTLNTSDATIHLDVQRLLTKYDCNYKVHEVRAAFMGAIASPYVVDPVFELNALWDGAFPELDSSQAIQEVHKVFLTDLWNALDVHADEQANLPFNLTPLATATTLAELKVQAQIRGEELDAFVDGFFQDQENVELSDEVAESTDILEELIGMCSEIMNMDPDTSISHDALKDLASNMQKMCEMAEVEMNNIILSCA